MIKIIWIMLSCCMMIYLSISVGLIIIGRTEKRINANDKRFNENQRERCRTSRENGDCVKFCSKCPYGIRMAKGKSFNLFSGGEDEEFKKEPKA